MRISRFMLVLLLPAKPRIIITNSTLFRVFGYSVVSSISGIILYLLSIKNYTFVENYV